tara:strand:- start:151 stop:915 length:765 start_codon:yes stop_codon:yes gene_type:complete
MENSIWGTSKKPTESKTVFGSIKSEPQQQVGDPNTSTFETHHVSKPIPIFTTILADHVEMNKYLKQAILEHRQNFPEDLHSNVKAWHSSWETHKQNPKFQPFLDIVCNACEFISEGYFQCDLCNYTVVNFWVMMYEESEHTIKHSHFPSDFSCVYYVDVEPGCAPVLFETPAKDGVNYNNETFTLQPENGLLAIWPSILHHEVPPTKSRRMCVSANIDKLPYAVGEQYLWTDQDMCLSANIDKIPYSGYGSTPN